jgi:NAD(P)-dependent dehydrogenase (short-subunit alcohol dehydrogenase family)
MSGRIVVTGAAGALGRAVIALLCERGWETVGLDLSEQALQETPHDTARDSAFVGGVDLTDENAVQAAFRDIAKDGPICGLVNIAGGFAWETVMDGSAASWDRMFRLNTLTALNASRAVIPFLPTGGCIVNIGAAATSRAAAGMGAYTASKSGVARMTEALADECKEKGLRINAVLPSIIDTAANRSDMGEDDADRWVKPQELAEAIAFLLSAAASGITGACIPVTGRV